MLRMTPFHAIRAALAALMTIAFVVFVAFLSTPNWYVETDLGSLKAAPASSPSTVVIVDALAPTPVVPTLPGHWAAQSRVSEAVLAGVPVLAASQTTVLDLRALDVVRAPKADLGSARLAAAHRHAIATGDLTWAPHAWLVMILTALFSALGGAMGWRGRTAWSTAGALCLSAAIGSGLLLSPLVLVVSLAAWATSDFLVWTALVAWAEHRIATTRDRRPLTAPTPFPIANR